MATWIRVLMTFLFCIISADVQPSVTYIFGTEGGVVGDTQIGPMNAQSDWLIWDNFGTWVWESDSSSFIYWGRYAADREWGAFRFTLSASLPDNCTVVSATLQLYGGVSAACDDSYIYVVDSADAGEATTAGEIPSIDGGSTTTYPNSAEGVGSIHRTADYTSSVYNDVDITGLIQYLVDTYDGVASGAHIVVYISGKTTITDGQESSAASTEGGVNLARLTILYH